MVIYESLFYGTPVLSSGLTPWDKLDEFNAGWKLDLNKPKYFVNKIDELIAADEESFRKHLMGCYNYINNLQNKDIVLDNLLLFGKNTKNFNIQDYSKKLMIETVN